MVVLEQIAVDVVLSIVLSVLYAISGLLDAVRNGESIDWPLFFKTIFIALVTAGFLTEATSSLLLLMLGTTVITGILDKIINAIVRGYRDLIANRALIEEALESEEQPTT